MSLVANLILPVDLFGSSYWYVFHCGGEMSSTHHISKWKELDVCFPVIVSTGSVCVSETYCCQGNEIFHPERAKHPTKLLVAVCSGDAFSITRNKGQIARTHTGISSLFHWPVGPSAQLSPAYYWMCTLYTRRYKGHLIRIASAILKFINFASW